MNILGNLTLSAIPSVNVDYYNHKLSKTIELAEIVACTDSLKKAIDSYTTLVTIEQLMKCKHYTDAAQGAAMAVYPSAEVNIFSIGGAIIKALYNVCKWVLGVIGKLIKWIGSFFRRDVKDATKTIDEMAEKVPLCQNESIGIGISEFNLNVATAIMDAHVKSKDVVPTSTPGMTIEDYKKLFYRTFNASVPDTAKVTAEGKLIKPIDFKRGAKLKDLGWTNADKMKTAAEKIYSCKKDVQGIVDSLKAQGGKVKKVANLCESSGYVKNKFIEENGPEVLDCACICVIAVNDIKLMNNIENTWVKMVDQIKNVSKKYIAQKN